VVVEVVWRAAALLIMAMMVALEVVLQEMEIATPEQGHLIKGILAGLPPMFRGVVLAVAVERLKREKMVLEAHKVRKNLVMGVMVLFPL
tara:strand:+ start:424 stop:690 length:267 start_codon:yes stop_codon:yes gene_type:complete